MALDVLGIIPTFLREERDLNFVQQMPETGYIHTVGGFEGSLSVLERDGVKYLIVEMSEALRERFKSGT